MTSYKSLKYKSNYFGLLFLFFFALKVPIVVRVDKTLLVGLFSMNDFSKGFYFGDNKVPKYLTEENGIAEIHLQVYYR